MLYNTPKPQDTKEGLSDQDFSIYMDAHTVPFSKYPSYLPEGVLGMCTEGNAEIQIGLRKYVICANDILIFMPGFLVSFIKSSLTFTIDYCTFSNALFMTWSMEVSNVFRPVFIPTPKPTASIRYPKRKRNSSPSISGYYTTELLLQLIYLQRIYYQSAEITFLELYADYYSTVKEHKVTTLHKEEIGYFFWICC